MKVTVDVFSDAICPWCYVGKKRLEKAMAAMAKDHEFDVVWHPFELNPHTPAGGVPRREYLSRKFGGEARLDMMDQRMKAVGEAEGIDFHQEKIQRTPNTLDAHRLIWWAGRNGKQDAVVDRLFRAYFSEGRDIGDRAVLAALAEEAGLPGAAAFLDGKEGGAEVLAAENEIKAAGVRGVPFFILNAKAVLEGAEAPEAFIQAVEKLAK